VKHIFREYFTYTSRERNGVLVLLAIVLLLFVFLGISDRFADRKKFDFTPFKKDVAAFEQSGKEFSDEEEEEGYYASSPGKIKAERFPFDPNTATEEDLERLGLSSKQVRAVISFRKNGGFSDKDEFAKVRAISPELYASLEPYILIPPRNESNDIFSSPDKKIIELNTADTVDLEGTKEIGRSFAWKIIRFRNALGGFISKQQLMEIKGMDEKRFAEMSSRISIDTTAIRKININTCTIEQLSKHPYLNYNQARAIVNYRTVHGSFTNTAGIRSCELVTEELYNKILPYLTVN
jgi:DNA uptake protein ComE-like DNA-binding protein